MKIKLLLSLILGISLGASAELVEEWNFGDNGNFSSVTTHDYTDDGVSNPTARHIGGTTTTASGYVGWEARATQGATLGTEGPAAGSSRLGSTGTATLNGYYGPSNFDGVPWAANAGALPAGYLTDGYYVASAAAGEIVDITVKVTDIDFDQTTGNSNNNANFSFRLWDKATGMVADVANTYFLGLTVLDTYNSDRLQLALTSSNGTILSGGTGLTAPKNRTRIGWLTPSNGILADSTDYEFGLSIDLAGGTWAAQINDEAEVTGTFDTSHLNGFDRYQATFQQFSQGDYIDVDQISVNVIPEPASVSLIALAGGSIMMLRRRFAR